jgi:hypothetical protein
MVSGPNVRRNLGQLNSNGCGGRMVRVNKLRQIRILTIITIFGVVTGCTTGGGSNGGSASGPNPQPAITNISPSAAIVGSGTQTLTINGSNFLVSSTVTIAGASRTPTLVNSGQLTIQLTTADQAASGIYPVVVSNPTPGGGQSNSVNFAVNNPQPALTSISPSVLATSSPDTVVTVSGTNFVSGSTVNLNGTMLSTTFVSSTQLMVTIPSSSLTNKGASQINVTSPSPGGGISGPKTLTVTAIGSFVLIATPSNAGQGTGAWQLAVVAIDASGTAVPGLPVTINSSAGTIGQTQGVTDPFGTFRTSVSPPASYSGQAVAVGATTGRQTAAINVAFVPSIFNSSSVTSVSTALRAETSSTSSTTLSSPFLYSVSGPPGSSNPFLLNPDLCYSNVDLATTVPTDCQTLYTNQGIVHNVLDVANTVCQAGTSVVDIVGAGSCVGIVATIVSCTAAPTGVGAVICAGGLTYSGVLSDLCFTALSDVLAKYILNNPAHEAAVDAIGTQPGSTGEIGLICDAISVNDIGHGTGTSGVQITVSPAKSTALFGSTIHFTAVVTGNSNTNVTWSVNGVLGGSGPFGTVDINGVYAAPSNLPSPFSWITVSATSKADTTAIASADVHVVANSLGTIITVAGNSTAGYLGDGGPSTSAELFTPTGVAFDGGGNMFVADYKNNVIRRVDAVTGLITTIAGNNTAGYSGDGGLATNAQLNGPTHVVFDRTVNLYITDANNNRIRKVNSETHVITTVAGDGIAGFSGDGGPATSAELNFPDGVALDGAENVYIGDARNNRIRKLNVTTGVITTVAGNGTSGFSGDGVLATNAGLNFPSRPTLDSLGNMYVADYLNNRVRRIDASTNIITTVAGNGLAGYSGDGGLASSASLNGPLSVTVDRAGNVYIGDINNERIRVVNMTSNPTSLLGVAIQPGSIQTVAGNGIPGYFGDGGPATNAQLNFPTGLLIDNQGNLYLSDANNNVVRRVTGQLQ